MANRGSAEFPARFFSALDAEADAGRALLLVEDFSASLTIPAHKARAFSAAGRLCELSGRTAEAAAWYDKALAADPSGYDAAVDFRAALCRLKAGEAAIALARAEAIARKPDAGYAAQSARLLSVWALAALGRREESLGRAAISMRAQDLHESLKHAYAYAYAYLSGGPPSQAPVPAAPTSDNPDAILFAALGGGAGVPLAPLFEPVFYLSGILSPSSPPDMAQAEEGKGAVSGSSPEAGIPPSPRSSPANSATPNPSPGSVSSAASKGSTASPGVGPSPAAPRSYLQVGVFEVQQNAVNLADALAKAGFPSEIRQGLSRSGAKRYYVIVPQDAQGMPGYMELKEAGFESVPFN
jgi:tetratricopeptide (TPR) repeat protein